MLTPKQEAFCLSYAKCGNATRAYNESYKPKNDKTAGACAARLLGNARVQERLQEIKQQIEDDKIMGVKERQQWLSAVIRDEICGADGKSPTFSDKIKANDILNRMQGSYAAEKVELTQMPVVLHDDVGDTS